MANDRLVTSTRIDRLRQQLPTGVRIIKIGRARTCVGINIAKMIAVYYRSGIIHKVRIQ